MIQIMYMTFTIANFIIIFKQSTKIKTSIINVTWIRVLHVTSMGTTTLHKAIDEQEIPSHPDPKAPPQPAAQY